MTSHFQFHLASLLHSRYLITFSLSPFFSLLKHFCLFCCPHFSCLPYIFHTSLHPISLSLDFLPPSSPFFSSLSLSVAINLIVQHIQDILSGDICKWQRGTANGHLPERILKRGVDETSNNPDGGGGSNPTKRPLLEPSTRPH